MALDTRFRPVDEFMYPDIMWVAADQVFNQIGKSRHMFGGDSAMPLVLRTKCAIGTGYGSQHSMDPAGLYWTGLLTAVLVSGVSLGLGARYLLRQMRLTPAVLLRSGG